MVHEKGKIKGVGREREKHDEFEVRETQVSK
jgi:hypothetical protein